MNSSFEDFVHRGGETGSFASSQVLQAAQSLSAESSLSGHPRAATGPVLSIQQRRLSEVGREFRRVGCNRPSRCVEIQRIDAIRLYVEQRYAELHRQLPARQTCLGTAMAHCLETRGKHTEPAHFRLMMACAEICRTSAHFMLLNSPHHKHVCKECAEICTECAKDCERVGGMEDCVRACRQCAESCRAMAG